MSAFQAACTAPNEFDYIPLEDDQPLAPDHVRGRTLVTAISPGTELAMAGIVQAFPAPFGYAAAFEVTETGSDVTDLEPGRLCFAMGFHRSVQQHPRAHVVPAPEGVTPEQVAIARLVGVTGATLQFTRICPTSTVLVTGLGPVGYLGAVLFHACGYKVVAVDPVAARRENAARAGIAHVRGDVADLAPDWLGRIDLGLECSGREDVVVEVAKLLRHGGELSLVGVPWKKTSDRPAFDLLHAIFHQMISVRSGWEHELSVGRPHFHGPSRVDAFETAMRLMAEGRIPLDGMTRLNPAAEARTVYAELMAGEREELFQLLDWR